jgi:L-ascorbate metabolism protein UlaG (beta-lactamase superfamily)
MNRPRVLIALLALLAASAGSAADGSSEVALRVRYVGNEGFVVEGDGRRVAIDALFGEGIPGYAAAPAPLRAELERGTGEWGSVAVALATHHHGDHFDPAAVGRFLEANPEARFVSTPQAVERLRPRGRRGSRCCAAATRCSRSRAPSNG